MKKILYIIAGAAVVILLALLFLWNKPVVFNADIVNPIGNLYHGGTMVCTEDSFYYIELSESGVGLYKCSKNGMKKELVADEFFCTNLLYEDGRIYFIHDAGKNISFLTEDNQVKCFLDKPVEFFTFYQERLYYIDAENQLFSADKNGLNPEKITDEKVRQIYFFEDKLFYLTNQNSVFGASLNGENAESLLSGDIYRFYVYKDKIYYTLGTGGTLTQKIYMLDMQTKKETVIVEDHVVHGKMNFSNGVLYYYTPINRAIKAYDTATGEIRIIKENMAEYVTAIYIVHDKVLYYNDALQLSGAFDKTLWF